MLVLKFRIKFKSVTILKLIVENFNVKSTARNYVITINRKQSGQYTQVAWNVNAVYAQNMMIQ